MIEDANIPDYEKKSAGERKRWEHLFRVNVLNRMQQAQGYDLSNHLGERCSQYSYQLTNYADSDGTVIITIYVQENEVIAGDIHTTAVNGFMHGLKRNAQPQK